MAQFRFTNKYHFANLKLFFIFFIYFAGDKIQIEASNLFKPNPQSTINCVKFVSSSEDEEVKNGKMKKNNRKRKSNIETVDEIE